MASNLELPMHVEQLVTM